MNFPFAALSPFTNAAQSARLVIEGDFDPQLPLRVLHRFSELGELPLRFVAHAIGEESLRIEVDFLATDDAARLLARRLNNLPALQSVQLSFQRRRCRNDTVLSLCADANSNY